MTIKLTIDEHGAATIRLANGNTLPVPADYASITLGSRGTPELIMLADGGEWSIADYSPNMIEGHDGELADGEAFASSDGTVWTRYGADMIVVTPPSGARRAA